MDKFDTSSKETIVCPHCGDAMSKYRALDLYGRGCGTGTAQCGNCGSRFSYSIERKTLFTTFIEPEFANVDCGCVFDE